jgi:hypothetical protein
MTYRERPAAIFARGVFCALALGPLVSSTSMRSAAAAPDDAHAANGVAAELRAKTQRLLDAIAPGNVAVWEELLDPAAIQVDENDRVRGKAEILADLKPLPPGLVGHLGIDDFRVALKGEVAVVTHEDDEYLDYHGQVLRSRFRMTDTWVREGGAWLLLGEQILAVLTDPPAVALDHATLCRYAGRYTMAPDISEVIRCAGDALVSERSGRAARRFHAELRDVFFEPGQPRTRRIFVRDPRGRISGFVDRREARDVVWTRAR